MPLVAVMSASEIGTVSISSSSGSEEEQEEEKGRGSSGGRSEWSSSCGRCRFPCCCGDARQDDGDNDADDVLETLRRGPAKEATWEQKIGNRMAEVAAAVVTVGGGDKHAAQDHWRGDNQPIQTYRH